MHLNAGAAFVQEMTSKSVFSFNLVISASRSNKEESKLDKCIRENGCSKGLVPKGEQLHCDRGSDKGEIKIRMCLHCFG